MNEAAPVGHNSDAALKSLVERIEALDNEKAEIAEDIRSVYKEADVAGFNTKVLRKVVQLRRRDKEDREEELAVTERYLARLGMI